MYCSSITVIVPVDFILTSFKLWKNRKNQTSPVIVFRHTILDRCHPVAHRLAGEIVDRGYFWIYHTDSVRKKITRRLTSRFKKKTELFESFNAARRFHVHRTWSLDGRFSMSAIKKKTPSSVFVNRFSEVVVLINFLWGGTEAKLNHVIMLWICRQIVIRLVWTNVIFTREISTPRAYYTEMSSNMHYDRAALVSWCKMRYILPRSASDPDYLVGMRCRTVPKDCH